MSTSQLPSSPLLLAGKVAAITGAVTGIGRAIALEYLRQGASVAVNYYPDSKSEELFSTLVEEATVAASSVSSASASTTEEAQVVVKPKLIGVAGDISHPETGTYFVERTVQEFGRLDVFVSNAGVCQFADFLSLTPTLLTSTISTNLSGAFFATQAAARQMSTQTSPQGGSIIGISSISALVGGAQQTHYTPTKAGVLSLMQSCACALGKYNIRCNALLPGTIRTQLNEEDLKDEAKREYMDKRIPLGRVGMPADLAGPAVFLASDLSAYVSGAQLLVDGGAFVNFQ